MNATATTSTWTTQKRQSRSGGFHKVWVRVSLKPGRSMPR